MNSFPDDIWTHIFLISGLESGLLYKNLILLCRQTNRIGYVFYKKAKIELSNHLWTLIKMLPDAPWDWASIAQNSNTSETRIRENVTKMHYYKSWSRNPNISVAFIEEFTHGSNLWDYRYLSMNPNITIEFIKWSYLKFHARWDFKKLCKNPALTIDQILEHINPNAHSLSKHPLLTWEIVLANPAYNFDIHELFINLGVPNDDIIKKLKTTYHIPKYWRILSVENLTLDLLKNNLIGVPWDWKILSQHSKIPLNFIFENPNLPWQYTYVSRHPEVNLQTIVDNPAHSWDYNRIFVKQLGLQKIINIIVNRDNLDALYPIQFKHIIISWRDFEQKCNFHRDPVIWDKLSASPVLTWEIVMKNVYCPWNFAIISANEFRNNKYF